MNVSGSTTSQAKRPADRPSRPGRSRWFAWQGWRIAVPRDWNVVRIEGDRRRGLVLLADLERPRMGLRWDTPRAGDDAEATIRAAMAAEVGTLAAPEATQAASAEGWSAAMLYLEPDPPGRDVWIGHSAVSGRIAQIGCPVDDARRRAIRDLPSWLADSIEGDAQDWSVLDLSCRTPPGWWLASHHLTAGDLRLAFTCDNGRLRVRQIAPARLALSRQPIEKWLAQHPLDRGRWDRAIGEPERAAVESLGGEITGLRQSWTRGGGGGLLRRLRRRGAVTTDVIALHDTRGDRLWIVESTDPAAAAEVIASLGWADADAPEDQK